MTAQPQRKYTLIEEEVELIEDFLNNEHCVKCPYEGGGVKSGIKSFIRSRPHTPAPCDTPELCTHIRKQRAEAARTATLAFCEEFLAYRKKHSAVYGASQTYRDEAEYVRERIESLRQQAGEQE